MKIPEISYCQLVTKKQGHFEVALKEKFVMNIDCYELMSWILDRDLLLVDYMLKTMSKNDSAKKWIMELDSLGYEFKEKIEEFITENVKNNPAWIEQHACKVSKQG